MLQRRNSASPSFHSLVALSRNRGVDATVKLATAAPLGVNRNSGSSVRFPTTVRVTSSAAIRALLLRTRPQHLGAQHGFVEVELAVELLHRGRLGRDVQDGVDALDLVVDLEGQPPPAPHVDLLDGAAVLADDTEERVEAGGDGLLLEIRIEDHH